MPSNHAAERRTVTQYLRLQRPLFFAALLIVFSALPITNWSIAQAEEDAYPRSNPLAGDETAIENGARLYFKWCVACHGNAADGQGTRFGGSWGYGANLTKFWRGYCDFVVIVLNGRTDKMMPPWGGVLEEEEISQVGAFLETLAAEGSNWKGRCTLL